MYKRKIERKLFECTVEVEELVMNHLKDLGSVLKNIKFEILKIVCKYHIHFQEKRMHVVSLNNQRIVHKFLILCVRSSIPYFRETSITKLQCFITYDWAKYSKSTTVAFL